MSALALFSVMCNATVHRIEKGLKLIGGPWGKRKRKDDWFRVSTGGSEKKEFKIQGVIQYISFSFVKNFCVWEEVGTLNCGYCRENGKSFFDRLSRLSFFDSTARAQALRGSS